MDNCRILSTSSSRVVRVPGDVLLHVAVTECAWAGVSPGLSLQISQSDLTH